MSQSKINFSFCLSVKYGRLFVILFRRRYAKSHINFALPFSNMFLRFDFSLYQIDSLPMSSFACTHSIVNINPQLSLGRYSFDVSTLHPANKWLIVSSYFPYSLHRLCFHWHWHLFFVVSALAGLVLLCFFQWTSTTCQLPSWHFVFFRLLIYIFSLFLISKRRNYFFSEFDM